MEKFSSKMEARILHGPATKRPFNVSLGQFFFSMCEKYGDKIAQIDSVTGIEESFNSVGKRSVRAAIEMSTRGVTANDVVVFCTLNCLDNVVPMAGATYLGAKIASLDPTLSPSHVKHLLNIVKPAMIFVEEGAVNLIEESIATLENQPQIVVLGQSTKYPTLKEFTQFSKDETTFVPVEISPTDPAILFFSSGTTGLPKAISQTSKGLLNYLNQLDFNYSAVLHFSSLYWISGMCMLVAAFDFGGYRVIMPEFDTEKALRAIEKYKVTFIFSAPSLVYKFATYQYVENFDISSIEYILLGGAITTPLQLTRIRQVFKNANAVVGYGMSETGPLAFFHPIEDRELMPKKLESCGKPVAGVSIKIVDINTRQPLPPYQKGEICVKSDSNMLGYYNGDSSDVFDTDGFITSGDVGYYDQDGFIYIVDRTKEMFKYQSWHIVPSVIEAVLLQHPAIGESCVFGVPDEENGELPAAAVVLKDGRSATPEEIAEFVARKVLDRERLRAGVQIVENLPTTPSGKLMRLEVKRQALKRMAN